MAGYVKTEAAHGRGSPADTPGNMPRKSESDRHIEERIRAHIREEMADRQIKQAEVAELTGIDDGHLSRILEGERGVGFTTLLKLCRGLGITPTRMLESDPPLRYWRDRHPGSRP